MGKVNSYIFVRCQIKYIFFGYSPVHKGYKWYHPPARKFYISIDVTFKEDQSFSLSLIFKGESASIVEDKIDMFFLDLTTLQLYSSKSKSYSQELSLHPILSTQRSSLQLALSS